MLMPAMLDLVLSLVMLGLAALVTGAVLLWRRGARRQAAMMAVLALILLGNIAIWTVPDEHGDAPLDQARQ